MTVNTPTRSATLLGTVALLAIALTNTAAAGPPVHSPDANDAAAQSGNIDPAIAAAIAAHRTSMTRTDERSPNAKDAAPRSSELDPAITAAIAAHRASVTAADKRSPDTKYAMGVHSAPTTTPQVSVVASDSVFDWTDAAIGAVAGFAIALLLGGMILLSYRGRDGSIAV
jgi:hypothetical protein